MDINNTSPNEYSHHLADQLIHSRVGQWSHTPGFKTTLRVKFLSLESDMAIGNINLGPSSISHDISDLGAFTSEEKSLALAALKTLEKEIGIDFVEVEDGPAELTFGHYSKAVYRTALSDDELAGAIETIEEIKEELAQLDKLTEAELGKDEIDKYKTLKEILKEYTEWKQLGNSQEAAGLALIAAFNSDLENKDSAIVSRGNFVGSVPIWIKSLAIVGKKPFSFTLAHEIGHALGLDHLIRSQKDNNSSAMLPSVLKEDELDIFNQSNPNNGFGNADLLALKAIYSMDKNKPVDLFHRGEMHYDVSDGHASVSPMGCAQWGDMPENEDFHNKKNEIIRLGKKLTPDNIQITLLESATGIKLTFADHPHASLTIKERSEPLIHGNDAPLRFKNIKLANGKTLSIDDQLYQTLHAGKQPQWQEGIPLLVGKLLPAEASQRESYEFSLADKQGDVAIKHFNLDTDKLLLPKLAGRQLHILAQGEKLSPDQRNEKHVIFRQKSRLSFDQKTKNYKLEFVLTHFNAQGERSNIFINTSQTPEIYNYLYETNEPTKENMFLPKDILEEIYSYMNINNPHPDELTRYLTEQLTHNRSGQWSHTPGVKTVLKVKFLSEESDMIIADAEETIPDNTFNYDLIDVGAFTPEEKILAMATLDTLEKKTGIRFQIVEDDSAHITFGHYAALNERFILSDDELTEKIVKIKAIEEQLAPFDKLIKDKTAQLTLADIAKYKKLQNALFEHMHAKAFGLESGAAGFAMVGFGIDQDRLVHGNFKGSIPIWVTSLSNANIDNEQFSHTVAHELGHALGFEHHIDPQPNDISCMSGSHVKTEELIIFNQLNPNNGFGNTDIAALKRIYSMDKPVDRFHRGEVHYDTADGHVYISPVGQREFQKVPEKQIIRLPAGITQNNIQITLLTSAPGIKLTFTDHPDASLTIKERSEPLINDEANSVMFINGGHRRLRFSSITLADGQMLPIDDQLYQRLKAEQPLQWQAGVPLVTKKLLPLSASALESYEFSVTDNQGEVAVNDFKFNTDKLYMPELAGYQLHILTQGEKIPQAYHAENKVIFRQKEIVTFDQKNNRYKLEFELIRFNRYGFRSKIFIDISQTFDIYNQLYANKTVNQDNIFLPYEVLKAIYHGLGDLNLVIAEPITQSIGTDGDDILYGDQGKDAVFGGKGHDQLLGDAGDDRLDGGEGNDSLVGGQGDDVLWGGKGHDQLLGDKGKDFLHGGAGNDQLWGGGGDDKLWGGQGDDKLLGGDGDDILSGDIGNDELWGEQGHDKLLGGDGDDSLAGGEGEDSLDGGQGNDILVGGKGNDLIVGHEGDDNLYGNEDNDKLWGNKGNDILVGGQGDDLLVGGEGDDILVGSKGNNFLIGNDGNDKLYSGDGNDILDGGEGSDIYLFNEKFGHDIIYSTENKANDKDSLVFCQNISKNKLFLKRQGLDLQVILNPQNSVTIHNFHLSGSNTIQEIEVDGYKLSKSEITCLTDAMMTFNSAHETNSTSVQNQLQIAINKYWQPIITTQA